MLATPHTLVGIAIGTAVNNPLIAVPLAFLSHFAGDLVPHWDVYHVFPKTREESILWKNLVIIGDILLGITCGLGFTFYALWVHNNPWAALNIFLCGIAGAMPDALYTPVVFMESKNRLLLLNIAVQKRLHIQTNGLWGNLTQWTIAIIASLVTLNLLRQ